MVHFAGLDVSVAETSICIVDDHGKIARERKVPTEPEAIIEALNGSGQVCERIGLEAEPLSRQLEDRAVDLGRTSGHVADVLDRGADLDGARDIDRLALVDGLMVSICASSSPWASMASAKR
jgi:hypothetical protein